MTAQISKSESIFGTTHTNIVEMGVEILQQNIVFWLFFILLLYWEILTKILLLYKYLQDCIVFLLGFYQTKCLLKKAFILFMNKQRYDVFELFGVENIFFG